MTIIDVVTGKLCVWTIFNKPLDYPNHVVARMFVMDKPTNTMLLCDSVDEAREILHRLYSDLYCLPRSQGDEPAIVETWL